MQVSHQPTVRAFFLRFCFLSVGSDRSRLVWGGKIRSTLHGFVDNVSAISNSVSSLRCYYIAFKIRSSGMMHVSDKPSVSGYNWKRKLVLMRLVENVTIATLAERLRLKGLRHRIGGAFLYSVSSRGLG